MMYGRRKSSPAIVARKPANKAARSATEPSVKEPAAAESVERRVGTKGNADWQSTRRTQRRVSVAQALERIRQMEPDCSAVRTRGGNRMRNVAPVDMWRSAPKVAAQAGFGFLNAT